LLEKSEQSSLVYIRWNQLHAALTEAHRKHSVFADSKKRALRVAKEALRAAEGYIHCQGQARDGDEATQTCEGVQYKNRSL
jgi:hypothetical protein